MNKRPKFIIGDNPMGEEQTGTFIIHLEDPIFYMEIFEHQNKQEQSDFHDYIVKFMEDNDINVIVSRDINFHQPFTLVFFGSVFVANKEFSEKIATIAKEMADWYKEFILWEEQNG